MDHHTMSHSALTSSASVNSIVLVTSHEENCYWYQKLWRRCQRAEIHSKISHALHCIAMSLLLTSELITLSICMAPVPGLLMDCSALLHNQGNHIDSSHSKHGHSSYKALAVRFHQQAVTKTHGTLVTLGSIQTLPSTCNIMLGHEQRRWLHSMPTPC